MNTPMQEPLKWTVRIDGGEIPSRELIGGKAWSIARMSALKLNVPRAFVVTTEAYRRYAEEGALWPELLVEIDGGLRWLEEKTGRQFAAETTPLLVSVRSGAAISMPGMMDTVLNLGVHASTRDGLIREFKSETFVEDTHRRFLLQYADVVLGAPHEAAAGLEASKLELEMINASPALPATPREQLNEAVRAVFESWQSRRARRYREHHGISHAIGTSVTIQAMVFGNMNDQSGTGVVFSRNPLSGNPEPYGEFLVQAQGEDVVSGKFTPAPLSEMQNRLPGAYDGVIEACRILEGDASEIQDIEFTVESGRLFILQSRTAKLAPAAALRTSVDLLKEGVIADDVALRRLKAESINQLLAPSLDPSAIAQAEVLARGEGACPGVGIGVVVGDADEAERRAKAGEVVILARPTTSPSDLHGMIAAAAIITEAGGSTSHAAVVSRALGRPCVVGCGGGTLVPALIGRTVTVEGAKGTVYNGSLPIRAEEAGEGSLFAEVQRIAARRSPLRVLDALEPDLNGECLDLEGSAEAQDPELIASVLARQYALTPKRYVRGGAIGSPQGIKAAISLGIEGIVCKPVLPALITASQLAAT